MQTNLRIRFWKVYSPIGLALGFGMLGFLCLIWLPFAFFFKLTLTDKFGHSLGRLAIRIGLNFYIIFLVIFCGCRFNISVEKEKIRGAAILVANHPSLLDAILLLALVPNTICVMKASLLDNPLLGASARLAGFIRNSDPFDMIAHVKEGLGEGTNILLFPEGTRSNSRRRVNTLNQSAALLSSKLDLPMRTFLIYYDQRFLGKGDKITSLPKLPMKISVREGEVFSPTSAYTDLTNDLETYFNNELKDDI